MLFFLIQKGVKNKNESSSFIKNKPSNGQTKKKPYLKYFKAFTIRNLVIYILLYTLGSATKIFAHFFLANWSSNSNLYNYEENLIDFLIFTLLDLSNCIFILFADFLFVNSIIRASFYFHDYLVDSIFRRPLLFFLNASDGEVLDRFTKEIEGIDNAIPFNLRMTNVAFFNTFSVIIVICVNSPFTLIFFIPVFIFYWYVQQIYTPYTRKCSIIQKDSQTKVTSLFSQSIEGRKLVKTFKAENYFISKMQKYLNESTKIYFCEMYGARWLGICLEFVGSIIIFLTSIFIIYNKNSTSPGKAAVLINYAFNITWSLKYLVKCFSDFQRDLISVSRITDYCETNDKVTFIFFYFIFLKT